MDVTPSWAKWAMHSCLTLLQRERSPIRRERIRRIRRIIVGSRASDSVDLIDGVRLVSELRHARSECDHLRCQYLVLLELNFLREQSLVLPFYTPFQIFSPSTRLFELSLDGPQPSAKRSRRLCCVCC